MSRLVYTLLALSVLVAGCFAVESITEESELESGIVFVKFFAPWCGHCKRMAPAWEELAERAGDSYRVAEVDCTQHTELCQAHGVRGYPTLILFKDGKALEDRYVGQRTVEDFAAYVEKHNPELPKTVVVELSDPEIDSEVTTDEAGVYIVTAGNFDKVVEDRTVFFRFHAPWCGHCKRMADAWSDLARHYAESDTFRIADVDCTVQKTLCGEFGVRGFPTLLARRPDGERIPYSHGGDRSLEKLDEFLETIEEQ